MFIGLFVGFIPFLIFFAVGHFGFEFDWKWSLGAKIIFWIIIFFVIIGICAGIGLVTDILHYDHLMGTWETTKANYEQAMSVYGDYESIIKDNPDLIKEAIYKNEELANAKYDATRWWYWYIDDSVQNLEPIIIGGTN